MPQVTWSARAETELEILVTDPAVQDQLRRNAEVTLHDIPPRPCPVDEGADDGIMWHRGITHEQARLIEAGWFPQQAGDGPESYFLLYRRRNPGPGWEVLAVRSIRQIAGWELMYWVTGYAAGPLPRSA